MVIGAMPPFGFVFSHSACCDYFLLYVMKRVELFSGAETVSHRNCVCLNLQAPFFHKKCMVHLLAGRQIHK